MSNQPPKSILDPTFKYTNSASTDVAATFRRIRKEMEQKPVNVTELKRAKTK